MSTESVAVVSGCRKKGDNAPFSVDSVESDRCDMPVENFAEIGNIPALKISILLFSQVVENVLHNLNFLYAVRIFCIFQCCFLVLFHISFSEKRMS